MESETKMINIKILCWISVCFIIQSVCCHCPARKTPNINKLANYINAWKKILICDKTANVEAIMDSTGRYYITTRVKVTETEDTKTLCNCMKEFLFQSQWTKNAKSVCHVECTTVTLIIIGIPDPCFIDAISVLESQEPIVSLAEVFGQYPNADLVGGKNCTSCSEKNEDGLLHVTFSCHLENSSAMEACENIYNYVNAGNFLSESTTKTCETKDGKVILDIVAKEGCFQVENRTSAERNSLDVN